MGTDANLLETLIGKKEVSKLSRREQFYYNECLGRIPAQKFLEFLNNPTLAKLLSLLQGGTQSERKQVCSHINSGRAIPRVVSVALPEKYYDIENKGKDLAKILRRDCKSIERVVQHLTKKEKENRHLRKIGQESYESLLLSQSANLLWLLSEHVIPQLER